MKKNNKIDLSKEEILAIISISILLFTTFINWTIYAWLLSLVIMIGVGIWYFKKK